MTTTGDTHELVREIRGLIAQRQQRYERDLAAIERAYDREIRRCSRRPEWSLALLVASLLIFILLVLAV
jgi:hypothetical protein